MKRNKAIPLFYLTILLLIGGCKGFAIEEKIIENYYLIATDDAEDLDLSYHEPSDGDIYGSVIGAKVFGVGYNDKYIIVKQHPRIFPNPPNTNITYYYILPIKKSMDWKSKNGLIGPLSLENFIQKRKELNIPEALQFNKKEY